VNKLYWLKWWKEINKNEQILWIKNLRNFKILPKWLRNLRNFNYNNLDIKNKQFYIKLLDFVSRSLIGLVIENKTNKIRQGRKNWQKIFQFFRIFINSSRIFKNIESYKKNFFCSTINQKILEIFIILIY